MRVGVTQRSQRIAAGVGSAVPASSAGVDEASVATSTRAVIRSG